MSTTSTSAEVLEDAAGAAAPSMALGAMYFGTGVDERTAFSILDRYADLGGSWIDTSDNYSFWTSDTGFGGQSEALLGRWLAANPGVRVRLSTKVGAQPTEVGGFPDHIEGLGESAVRRALAGSLTRLGVDAVELYWAHVEDPSIAPAELVATFGGLVRDGLTARWGVSNHPSWLLERIRATAERDGYAAPTGYQQRYSYFQPAGAWRWPASRSSWGCCRRTGWTSCTATPRWRGGSTRRRCRAVTTVTTVRSSPSTVTRARTGGGRRWPGSRRRGGSDRVRWCWPGWRRRARLCGRSSASAAWTRWSRRWRVRQPCSRPTS